MNQRRSRNGPEDSIFFIQDGEAPGETADDELSYTSRTHRPNLIVSPIWP